MEVEIIDDLETFIETIIVIVILIVGVSTILLLVAIIITAINEERNNQYNSLNTEAGDGNHNEPMFSRRNSYLSDGGNANASQMRIATNEVGSNTINNNYNISEEDRKKRTIARRGAFKWLPVYFSNDLVHGSYWFLLGSVFYSVISIVPVYMDMNFATFIDELKYRKMSDIELQEESATFTLFSLSGLLFSLGSVAFIRATDDIPLPPMFPNCYHISSDELLAAWLFLLGAIPFPCSILVLLYYNIKSIMLWIFFVMSLSVIFSSYLFVISCYPGEIAVNNQNLISSYLKLFVEEDCWIFKHLSNDWLAGCWFFYITTFIITIGSFGIFLYFYFDNYNGFLDSFIWFSSTIDCIIFLIGGAYFIAGSYQQNESSAFILFPRHSIRKNCDEETSMLENMNNVSYGSIHN